ncbi:MAG: VanZ family protein [Atopobiaceae bacterium]|nr:VanZ family protein [Atopobiaceae bacterium]
MGSQGFAGSNGAVGSNGAACSGGAGPTGTSSSKRSRVIWTLLLVAWLGFIWGHSMVPGDESTLESSRFVFLVRPIFELFGSSDERLMTFVIRKIAHFSEYAVLMAIGIGTARAWFRNRRARLAMLAALWVAVPSLDETIQYFVPGRDARVTDVLIDMAGGLTGMLLVRAWLRRHSTRNARKSQTTGESRSR